MVVCIAPTNGKANPMPLFHRLIMADWSAASAPGPKKPHKDRCWVGKLDTHSGQPQLAYCRTRAAAREVIAQWTAEMPAGCKTLIGFDFPFGYPAGSGLPGGRALATLFGSRLQESANDRNDRFELAGTLNEELYPGIEGPFWGHPSGHSYAGLRPTRPKPWPTPIPEYRIADGALRHMGIQTVWKLAYPASVGSQVMTGMASIHHLLQRPAFASAAIWPFETAWEKNLPAVTIAEIWPNLFFRAWREHPAAARHEIRDAQQIAASLLALAEANLDDRIEAMLAAPEDRSGDELAIIERQEGWIVGAAAAS